MRYLAVLAAAAAVLAVVPAAIGDSGKDYNGPSCTNFISGDAKYSAFGGSEAFVRFDEQTASPTCKNASYTLYVLDATGAHVLAQQTVQGGAPASCPLDPGLTDATCVSFTIDLGPAATAPADICVYAVS